MGKLCPSVAFALYTQALPAFKKNPFSCSLPKNKKARTMCGPYQLLKSGLLLLDDNKLVSTHSSRSANVDEVHTVVKVAGV
jgi:hypothetical protein